MILLATFLSPLLWLVGAIGFDGVHWLLHRMLRSRYGWARWLATPHAVHHAWIDRKLATNWELQSANVWCHIVPEYLTQLVFSGLVLVVLPPPFAGVLVLLQTVVFLGILSARGRDVNHRPAARIDAHPMGWRTPPAYHALHHVWPDAYFSAYTKVVDRIVGGGTQIAERRFAWDGRDSMLGDALRKEVEGQLGRSVPSCEGWSDADVLVLLDAASPLAIPVEAFIEATRDRQLPPEVWALRARADDPVARHYENDIRVTFRTLLVPGSVSTVNAASRAARRAIFWLRRDAHFLDTGSRFGVAALRKFRRTSPVSPPGVEIVRHRIEFVPGTEPVVPAAS